MTTFRDHTKADLANDGNDNSFTHTNCGDATPWWEVDLQDVFTITSLKIVNRLDCCGGRLHDFDIWFLDENKNVTDSIFNPGTFSRKTLGVRKFTFVLMYWVCLFKS